MGQLEQQPSTTTEKDGELQGQNQNKFINI